MVLLDMICFFYWLLFHTPVGIIALVVIVVGLIWMFHDI